MGIRPLQTVAFVCLACGIAVRPARAQLCEAGRSLRTTGYRVGVGGATATNIRHVALTGAVGDRRRGLWSGAAVGLTRLTDIERTAVTTSVSVGLEAPLDTARRSGLCPFVDGGTQSGPNDILGTGVNYSDVELGLGLAIGRELKEWDGGMVAVALEGSYLHAFYAYKGPAGTATGGKDYQIVTAVLGVATGRVLIRFSVAQPVFVDGAVISYGLSLSLLGPGREPER